MPKANDPGKPWFALLGRRDTLVDGVADYCAQLRDALASQGIELRLIRVDWVEHSWLHALRTFCESDRTDAVNGSFYNTRRWDGWSRRGFPVGALLALAVLRMGGARCALTFHEPSGTEGPRLIDCIRRAFQNCAVQTLYHFSEKSV